MAETDRQRPPIRRRRIQFNQALKLTRLSGCLFGGPASGHAPSRGSGSRLRRAAQGNYPLSAVQLSASVRRPEASDAS